MKNKKLLILLPALLLSLAACNGNNEGPKSSEQPASSQSDTVAVTAVAIKATLELEPGASETLTATVTPDNASNTKVIWSSSDETIATVSALGKVTAVKVGTCKIIATSESNPEVKGECALTVKEITAKELYGTEHKGTEDDPLTNEDAITVAKHKDVGEKATTKQYYIKGEVEYFTELPGNSNGNVSFAFKAATGKTERFLAYRVKKGAKLESVSVDDVWKGAQVTILTTIVNYKGNTPETEANKGSIMKVEGTKVAQQTIAGKSVNDALTLVAALNDNESTYDKYEVTGYITKVVSAGTFFMSDTKGVVETTSGTKDFEVYGYSGEHKAECTVNAKVKVTCALKKYVSTTDASKNQYETGFVYAVDILEEGDEAEIKVKGATPLDAVVKDTEYFAGINQATINKNCFLTGAASGTYLATGPFTSAKAVVLKEATGGFNLQFKDGKYVNMNASQKLELGDAASTVYTWDTVAKSLVTTSGSDKYYLCAYSTFETLGFSKESYVIADGKVKDGQFPLQFYAKEAAVAPTEIQITQKANVEAGQKVTLALRFNPYNADMTNITWTSSAEAVAKVDKGVVTGVAAGTATITAAVGNVKDTCTVTVTASTAVDKDLPAAGLVVDSAALDLTTNNTYAKNNNRAVTVSGIGLTLDPSSEGTITKASAPYTAAGALKIDCMQFKKGNLVGFKTSDKIKAATTATVEMYTSGYATEGKDYLPYFLAGGSDPILANETNGGTANATGVDTTLKDGTKVLYKYTLTYNLSGLSSDYITFVTAKSGAAYIGSIKIVKA